MWNRWKTIENYYWTLKYLKPVQLYHLVKNRLERRRNAVTEAKAPEEKRLQLWMEELDGAPEYLRRFDTEEILAGQVTLLYESGTPGGKNWEHPSRSHLWNFNLHYLEFLTPLAAAYRRDKNNRYYDRFRAYCRQWIEENREGTGDGWHPYTISLRLTNLWICMDGFGEIFWEDVSFRQELNDSMYAQYRHLQKKQELHLLGNHYFENLKAVLLGSFYFQEPEVSKKYLEKFQEQMKEQILADGMHYERSPMYHKIILEDIMRVAKAVRMREHGTWEEPEGLRRELLQVLQQMADAAWSLEKDMGHTPLFNDSGDNVARPLGSLLDGLKAEFGITPELKQQLLQAGYYFLEQERIRIILDAGEIAPPYMPGHGHCDGLSFELSLDGKPLFVNSGTGLYQGNLRSYFRSTAAHNTVMVDGKEQSQCWGEHRVGKRIRSVSGMQKGNCIKGGLITCFGKRQNRMIRLTDKCSIEIQDRIKGHARAFFHLAPEYEYVVQGQKVFVKNKEKTGEIICEIQGMRNDSVKVYKKGMICSYAPEFGKSEYTHVLEIRWDGTGAKHVVLLKFILI